MDDPSVAQPLVRHEFQWDLYLIVSNTMVAFVVDVLAMKHGSSPEKATSAVRLTLTPQAYGVMFVALIADNPDELRAKLLTRMTVPG